MPKGIRGFVKGNSMGGRAETSVIASRSRKYIMNAVEKDLEPIVLAQREAAKGMYVEKKIGKKKVIVYRLVPELKAGEYLLNQLIGKAKETIEHEGGPILNIDKMMLIQMNKLYDKHEGNGKFVGNGQAAEDR